MGDKEEIFWVEEQMGQLSAPVGVKRKSRTKKVEYVSWGSRPLIEFLESVGSDTSKKISQYDVADIVNKYVNDHKLLHPVKKKRIVCDESLLSLFGRKTIAKNKIYEMLGTHFAENQVDSDDDLLFSSEEDVPAENQKKVTLERKVNDKKKLKTPTSEFAAIIPDNIKLIYLKRSLVQELLKDSETFEAKIVGSIVRVKSDPYDYLQKNSHMLVQVTGLKNTPGSNHSSTGTDIVLQVSNFMKDVSISMLSEDNFSEEECKDLHQRIKNSLLKRPTIVELQQKVEVLHKDITNHWLVKELALLQKQIDRANEKGWRRELFEYLERKRLLQTPDEQARLLREVPNLIPEEIEVEGALADPDNIEKQDIAFPEPTPSVNGGWKILKQYIAGKEFAPGSAGTQQALAMTKQKGKVSPLALELTKQNSEIDFQQSSILGEQNQPTDIVTDTENKDIQQSLSSEEEEKQPMDVITGNENKDFLHSNVIDKAQKKSPDIIPQNIDFSRSMIAEEPKQPSDIGTDKKDLDHSVFSEEQKQRTDIDINKKVLEEENQTTGNGTGNKGLMQCHKAPLQPNGVKDVTVIDLSDGEESEDSSSDIEILDYDLESFIWYYMDPQGIVQGPFSLKTLKRWYDDGYFPQDFKVWKSGQIQKEAVLLTGIFQVVFRL